MWRHTPSLDFLIILTTIAPAELLRVATSFGMGRSSHAQLQRIAHGGTLLAYTGVTVLALAALWLSRSAPVLPFAVGPAAVGYGAFIGVLAFVVEYLLGVVALLRDGRRLRLRLRANTAGSTPGLLYLSTILLVAVVEEVLYRGIWLGILLGPLRQTTVSAIVVCALGYAAGHLFFGWTVVAQKFASGAIFAILLITTGSLAAPIIAHMCLNGIVFIMAQKQQAPA